MDKKKVVAEVKEVLEVLIDGHGMGQMKLVRRTFMLDKKIKLYLEIY